MNHDITQFFKKNDEKSAKIAGFSLMEVILATALFVIVVGFVGSAILFGQENSFFASKRARAVFIANEGLEAVRNTRDENYNTIANGTYGLALTNNQWTLTGSSDITDGFMRQISISTIDSHTKSVTSTVTWQQNSRRDGKVSITTYLTDWRVMFNQAANLTFNTSSASTPNKNLSNITIQNNGLFEATIDKIKISWAETSKKIETVSIGSKNIWSMSGIGSPLGRQSSGTLLDNEDYTLPANGTASFSAVFNGTMNAQNFTIIVTMKDGTQKTVSFSAK